MQWRGADYLFALKADRPAMLEGVRAFFADPALASPAFETTDADHRRIEVRRHRVSHDVAWLFSDRAFPDAPRMPDLATIACVEAERTVGGITTRAVRYEADPERSLRAHSAPKIGHDFLL